MSEFFTLRARRFHALHDLLTGPHWRQKHVFSSHPAEDLGRPSTATQAEGVGPLGTFIRETEH